MSVYCSLVYSHLQYAIICWGNSSKTIKNRLQVKQNRIIKALCNKFGTKTRLKPLYEQLQVPNIDEIYKLDVAKFMAKVFFFFFFLHCPLFREGCGGSSSRLSRHTSRSSITCIISLGRSPKRFHPRSSM